MPEIEFDVRIELTGKSPLVMHNGWLADPENPYVREMKKIADKGSRMTDEDRKTKDDLHWRGCLVTEWVKEEGSADPVERITVPMDWLMGSLESGGSSLGSGTSSKGAAVVRSVTPRETFMMLNYDGPRDIDVLLSDPRFRWRTLVNPNPSAGRGKSKLPSVRPVFPRWSASTELNVVTDMGLSQEDFERACRAAGNVGIGDARKKGRGRYSVKLTRLH